MASIMEKGKKNDNTSDKKVNNVSKASKVNIAAKPGKMNKPNSSIKPGTVNKSNSINKSKLKSNLADHKYTSLLYKVILVAILAVVFYPPYSRGLFFEDEFIRAELFVFIIFAAFWVYKILKKEKLVFDTPLDYASFAFAIVYLISIIAAVGLNLAVNEWLKYCMYFAIFFILTDLAADFRNRLRVLWIITFSAIGVCIIGIDAFAGNNIVRLLNNIFNKYYEIVGMPTLEKGKFFGLIFAGRISSTLQYPNTLAAYLMTAFFVSVGLTLLSKSMKHRMLSSFAGFLSFVTLIFTLSRGALLILPFMIILLLIVLPKRTRVKGTVYTVVPLIASIPSIIKISEVFNTNPDGNPEIWLWVIAGSILSLILSLVSDYVISFLENINWKTYIYIFGAIIVVACVGIVMIFNARQPLTVAFPADSQAPNVNIMRSVILPPDKEYRMTFGIEGKSDQDNDSEYEVSIFSNSEKEILAARPNLIKSVAGKVKSDRIQAEMDFVVPLDSKIMYINFYNKTKGTEIKIDNCLIIDPVTGEQVVNVPLEYKYIPELILSRLQDLQVNKSTIERMVFYKNGLEMFGDHWLIGAGGGAWSLLNFSYQSYLYYSTQAHNYFLQTAIEAGVVGILAVLFLLFSIVFMFIKQRYNKNVVNDKTVLLQAILFTILVNMFLHAGIDFDFSFPAMLLLVWEILALYNAGAKELAVQNGGYKLPCIKELKVSASLVLLVAFIFIIRTGMTIGAGNSSENGIKALNEKNTNLAISYFENAAELNPLKSEYKINYSNLVINKKQASAAEREKAGRWIGEAERLSRYDVSMLTYVGKYYFSTGNITKSIDIIESAIKLRPFRPEEWEQLTGACNSAWAYYNQNNNKEQAMAMAVRALNTISWATEVNKKNMDPFIFNPGTSQTLEQFTYYKDKQKDKELTGLETIVFYSMPSMDIDSNGIPDQWNATLKTDFILKTENNMLRVDKVTTAQDSFIQSRLMKLKPNSKYRIDLTLDNESEPAGMRYLVAGVSAQVENFEFSSGVHSAVFTTLEKPENNSLMLYIDKSCIIKGLRITEIK